jgi:hypothetical protein
MNSYRNGRIGLIALFLGFLGVATNFVAGQSTGTLGPVVVDTQTLYTLMMIGVIVNICLFAAVIALLISLKSDMKKRKSSK